LLISIVRQCSALVDSANFSLNVFPVVELICFKSGSSKRRNGKLAMTIALEINLDNDGLNRNEGDGAH
jgi:hypothetical protein